MRNRRADYSPWFFGMETKLSSGHLSMLGPFGSQVSSGNYGSSRWDVWG